MLAERLLPSCWVLMMVCQLEEQSASPVLMLLMAMIIQWLLESNIVHPRHVVPIAIAVAFVQLVET